MTACPETKYRALVTAGEILPDPAQEKILIKFNLFLHRIRNEPAKNRNEATKQNFSFLRSIADMISPPKKNPPETRGIYLYGDVGRGKSMLADLFFECAPLKPAEKERIHFHAFMRNLHAQLHQLRQKGVNDPLLHAAEATARRLRLLCFDELQVNDIADASVLGRFFEILLKNGTYITVTSNRPPEDLYLNGLNREIFLPCIAMIRARFEVLSLNHDRDYRQERDLLKNRFLFPLTPETGSKAEAIWSEITRNQPEKAAYLTVNGRKITVLRTSDESARFTFVELCAVPLAASDYLALGERFSTFLITDIPRLDPEKTNEATRFRTLIDALYEAKRLVYFTAAAEPENLYPQGNFAFEFERTASRLSEMRSENYPPR